MSRLILVPQYPAKMRYQSWWTESFVSNLSEYFDDIIVLGDQNVISVDNPIGSFSPVYDNINFELEQIRQYMDLELQEDDVLLHLDLSFPGIFHTVLFHKRPDKCFVFCHGTSLNNLDYYEPVRNSKSLVESGFCRLYDKVFVATEYHKQKLLNNGFDDNISVMGGLPFPKPFVELQKELNIKPFIERKNSIVSVSRETKQKVTKQYERQVEKEVGVNLVRKTFDSWKDYYNFLADSKILFLTGKEDTYGYSILDALLCGCYVVAPNKFSYPELLTDDFLYNKNNFINIIQKILINPEYLSYRGYASFTEHSTKQNIKSVLNFYRNLALEMLE